MRTSILVAVLGLLVVPVTATAATPAAKSRAAFKRVAPAAFALDQKALADVLEDAPAEGAVRPLTISVPSPDGGFERFAVAESPVMEPELAAAHPEIKTYTARGLDDPSASARLDLTPVGFHASVRSASGAWYVDPRDGRHVAYRRTAVSARPFEESGVAPRLAPAAPAPALGNEPVTLRTYRLALISDPDYATDTPGTTTVAKAVLVNRLNQIYEQDLAIRLVLVANNDVLNLDTDALASTANGRCGVPACYTPAQLDDCDDESLARTNAVAARLIGPTNYDIAHLAMGGGGGGLAGLGVVGTPFKGNACTASATVSGDVFDVDYVAHEVGHQFGADHTFASQVCESNLADTEAVRVEPGGGSSIMSYAGICGADNLQNHSDPYFSQASIRQITAQAQRAEVVSGSYQQVALNNIGPGNTYTITYNGNATAAIGNGATAATIQTRLRAVAGLAGVFVVSASGSGFTVAGAPGPLQLTNVNGFDGGFVAETWPAGAATRYGGTPQVTGNRSPDVALKGAAAYTIPTRTPFLLDATGSDLDGDTITYLWEQNDGASAGTALSNPAKANGPLFRIFGTPSDTFANAATTTPSRSFPDIDQVRGDLTNASTGTCVADVACSSELLPTNAWVGLGGTRTLHFRVTARDNHPGSGGTSTADIALTVAAGTGPFRLTSQTAGAPAAVGAALPVTWAVNGTDALAPLVRISLSLDGGRTFSKVLAAATPNDGSELVTVPRVTTTAGVIKVEAVDNVFYDAARGALTVDAGSGVVVNGPGAADLGPADIGGTGTPVTLTFTRDAPGGPTTGALSAGGPDAAAIQVLSDECGSRTLAPYSQCTVAVRLAPVHGGAQSATLSLPSDDPGSPATVALTGTAPTPSLPPPPSGPGTGPAPVDPAQRAAGLLGTKSPFAVGSAGNLRLYTKSRSTKLGKPKARLVIAAAVCAGGTCSGKATAKLTLTPRKGRKRSYNFTLVKSLKLADGRATALTLKLGKAERRRIGAARRAALTLTVTNGRRKVTRAFTLTT
jgi:hypothetical protein